MVHNKVIKILQNDDDEAVVVGLHDQLAKAYVTELSTCKASSRQQLTALRSAFRRFMEQSQFVDVSHLASIMKPHPSLNADRAFLLGRVRFLVLFFIISRM